MSVALTAGQYISFDSSHIWETGIQTYLAGLQHLPIAQPADTIAHQHEGQGTIHTTDASDQGFLPSPNDNSQPAVPSDLSISNEQQQAKVYAPQKLSIPEERKAAPGSHSQLSPVPLSSAQIDPDRTDSSIIQSDLMPSRIARNVFLCLAAHNGSVVNSFLEDVADPSEWEVYVWQAPQSSAQSAVAQQYLKVARKWEAEAGQFTSFVQAAGEQD